MEDSGRSPKALEAQPEVYSWMAEYVEAFTLLTNKRSSGFGLNPITLSDMYAYIALVSCSDVPIFLRMISLMDEAFMEEMAKKQKANSK